MDTAHILPIRNEIAAAAADLKHCDTEQLRDIALEILRTIGERERELKPTPVQRAVLCQVAAHLISSEAFGRSTWRLQAAATALRTIDRLFPEGSSDGSIRASDWS